MHEWLVLLLSGVSASALVLGTSLAYIRHVQESNLRKDAEFKLRLAQLEAEIKRLNSEYSSLRSEVYTRYVRDHELRDFRTEVKDQFHTLGVRFDSLTDRLNLISGSMERIIGRLKSEVSQE